MLIDASYAVVVADRRRAFPLRRPVVTVWRVGHQTSSLNWGIGRHLDARQFDDHPGAMELDSCYQRGARASLALI